MERVNNCSFFKLHFQCVLTIFSLQIAMFFTKPVIVKSREFTVNIFIHLKFCFHNFSISITPRTTNMSNITELLFGILHFSFR